MSSAMQCHVILDEAKNQDKVDNERLGELLLLKFDHSKFFSRFLLRKVKYCSFGIGFDVNPSFDFEKYCQHFSLNSVAVQDCISKFRQMNFGKFVSFKDGHLILENLSICTVPI